MSTEPTSTPGETPPQAPAETPEEKPAGAPHQTPDDDAAEMRVCTFCGERIKAAALKCRHCHTRFDSAVPASQEEYQRLLSVKQTRKSSANWTVVLFITSIVPCFSPLVLLIGGIIYFQNRDQIRHLSPLSKILARLGISIAALWILLALVIWAWTGRTSG